MSRENVEVVRRAYEAANRGDVDTVVSLSHPEVVLLPLRSATEGAFHGHEGIRRYFFWDHAEALEAVGLSQQDVRGASS